MKIACKKCGADLKYVPKTQNVYCEYCGNYFDIDEIEFDPNKYDDIDEYTCSSCGAKLITTGKPEIITCLYCGGKEFVNAKINNEYIMTGIIPFKLDKAYFIKSYENYLKTVRDIDLAFYGKLKDARITGFYLPYSFANQFYRKQYSKILNDLLEKIAPYNFKNLKEMNPIYLDTFVAETIKIKKSENDIVTDDVSFFWVPVWIAYLEYENEKYYIVMNGQTGEMAGVYKNGKNNITDNKTKGLNLASIFIKCMLPLIFLGIRMYIAMTILLEFYVIILINEIYAKKFIKAYFSSHLKCKSFFTVQKFDIENDDDPQ